jgi:hypothetical protein
MEQRHSVAPNRNPIRQYRFAASSPGSRQQHGDDLFGNVSYPFCNGNPSEIRKWPLKTSRLSRASVAHGLRVLLNLGCAAPRFKPRDAGIGPSPARMTGARDSPALMTRLMAARSACEEKSVKPKA